MPIDPGSYNTRLSYQEPLYTTNSVGQQIETWNDVVGPLYARVRTLSGREQFYAQSVNALATVEITCRWHPSIKETGRFVVDGRLLSIVGLSDFESRRIELTIMAIEQKA